MVLVACAQMCSTDDVAHNLATSLQLARDAAAAGAKALFLPEAADYITGDAHLGYLLAQPLASHKFTIGLQEVAKELGIYIMAGIHERPAPDEPSSEEPGSERVFNTHVSIGPDGKIKAAYRKIHLFDVQLNDTTLAPGETPPRSGEHRRIIPGSVICDPVDLGDIGRLGLEVCYDIRFPELHIILRRKGSDIIAIPSAFTIPTGRAHWHTLLRSVAINYQVYVIAATQAGAHSPERVSWGEALVFDPWGIELGRLPSIDEAADPKQPMPPQFLLVDIDRARVESVRTQIPVEFHKRDDVYGVVGRGASSPSSETVADARTRSQTRLHSLHALPIREYSSLSSPSTAPSTTVSGCTPLALSPVPRPSLHPFLRSHVRLLRKFVLHR